MCFLHKGTGFIVVPPPVPGWWTTEELLKHVTAADSCTLETALLTVHYCCTQYSTWQWLSSRQSSLPECCPLHDKLLQHYWQQSAPRDAVTAWFNWYVVQSDSCCMHATAVQVECRWVWEEFLQQKAKVIWYFHTFRSQTYKTVILTLLICHPTEQCHPIWEKTKFTFQFNSVLSVHRAVHNAH